MAVYDLEQLIDDIISKIKTPLNSHIAQINIDKGDSLLSSVSSSNYFYRKDSPKNKACDVFVYYEAPDDVAISDNETYKYTKSYICEFGICYRENNKYSDSDENNFKKCLRYQKAFELALLDIFSSVRGYSQVKINSIKSSKEERDENLLHISSFNLELTIGG